MNRSAEPASAEMPDPAEPVAGRADALAHIGRICFKIGPPRLVGLELEWLLGEPGSPATPLELGRLAEALGPWCPAGLLTADDGRTPAPLLAHRSTVTVEPGGQVEISTAPAASLTELIAAASADAAQLQASLAGAGLAPISSAADPFRPPRRLRNNDRYTAMETYFDRRGASGRTMMCSTAAVQTTFDAGMDAGPDGIAERWRALHVLGPTLIASFANSPWLLGRPTGWKSAREAAWLDIDPARTRPPAAGDPRETYPLLAVEAPLLFVRGTDGALCPAPRGITLDDWLVGRLDTRPTYGDLAYHLTTLFPPVRAQGHLEVRYLDAQAGQNWIVAAAVTWALMSSQEARDTAVASAEPVADRWEDAARFGLEDAALAAAAREVIGAALEVLADAALPAPVLSTVTDFAERYTMRGRCPADDWAEGPPDGMGAAGLVEAGSQLPEPGTCATTRAVR
ncbi:MAG TPA: ergothioneine biosynthesis glutamate--cysteine ligase EgtA [Jatrophihabitantaceae bacterium]|jgi:glutamate--cysteine ligase|nr:ergothioneine biosynthesis glutamate--cysteine ligase EgtA [Jatrophihabitantaceae bacterium]